MQQKTLKQKKWQLKELKNAAKNFKTKKNDN